MVVLRCQRQAVLVAGSVKRRVVWRVRREVEVRRRCTGVRSLPHVPARLEVRGCPRCTVTLLRGCARAGFAWILASEFLAGSALGLGVLLLRP